MTPRKNPAAFRPTASHAVVGHGVRRKQRGTSLLEGIAYLAIAALVILGAVALLMGAFSGANTNRTETEIASIRTGVKKLFMGSAVGYGTASLLPELSSAKVLPRTLVVDNNNATNTFGGAVVVTGTGATFTISYAAVPQDVCVSVVSAGGDWTALSVNGNALSVTATPAQASAACSTATNTIVWTAS